MLGSDDIVKGKDQEKGKNAFLSKLVNEVGSEKSNIIQKEGKNIPRNLEILILVFA